MAGYDDAVAELYQAPHGSFVTERKRLAAQLKSAGDKDGATRLAKLPRPTISAWIVNQLWWHARDAFDTLFDTAARLRTGKLDATAAHREALVALRQRATRILTDADHGASEATLRRIGQTLSALAATGSWAPDAPGSLAADRDPPGFEAIGITNAPPSDEHAPRPPPRAAPPSKGSPKDELAAERERRRDDAERAEREREQAAAERRRHEQDRARRAAERHRLEAVLRTAKGEIAVHEREITKLEKQLADARDSLAQAHAVVDDLAARLEPQGDD